MKFKLVVLSIACLMMSGGSLSADLIGHWTLDEDPTSNEITVADSSGPTVHDGTLFLGGPPLNIAVAGQIGGAFDFGEIDQVRADLGDDLVTGNGVATATAWFNPDSFISQSYIFSYGTNSPGENLEVTLEDDGDDGGVLLKYRHFGGAIGFPAPSVTVDSGWHHVAMVVPDGATTTDDVLLYLDGEAVAGNRVGGENRTLNVADSDFFIGKQFLQPDSPEFGDFDGQIDDVGYWNEVLTGQQIRNIYTGGLAGYTLQQSIPEPAGVSLLALAGLVTLLRRSARPTATPRRGC